MKKHRIWALSMYGMAAAFVVVIICVFVTMSFGVLPSDGILLVVFSAAIVFGLICFGEFHKDSFRSATKEAILKPLIKRYYEDAFFTDYSRWGKKPCGESELHEDGSYASDDYIAGVYNGVYFEQSDVDAGHEERHTSATYFTGRWIIFNLVRDYGSHTQIRSKDPYGKNNAPQRKTMKTMERINAGNKRFNERFDVYSTSKCVAESILTDDFMERLLKLYNRFKCEVIVGFIDDKLHVTIDWGRNSFEANLLKFDLDEYTEQCKKDLQATRDVIDILGMDESWIAGKIDEN